MIDSCESHCQTLVRQRAAEVIMPPDSIVQSLAPNEHKQNGRSHKGNTLASLLHSSRKWISFFHIYIESMVMLQNILHCIMDKSLNI